MRSPTRACWQGWKDYLAHDNHGRPIVFIGHSQGAANLIRLLRSQVDGNAALRDRMVSAIILGGNVQVPVGKTVGGTFAHIPACTKTSETGCVIAYSSFSSPPPAGSLFGRPGQGVSLQSGQEATRGQQVVCTNPSVLGATGAEPLTPYFVSSASSTGEPWVTYPGLYTGACETSGGATWLQIDSPAGDSRPVVTPTLGPDWGLHARRRQSGARQSGQRCELSRKRHTPLTTPRTDDAGRWRPDRAP